MPRSPRPLAAASERLQRKPGRPPVEKPARPTLAEQAVVAVAPVVPRLLDVEGGARYCGVSAWTIRDLEATGVLARVRIPLPNGGELRKVLFDREDLDRLIARWKES